MIDELDQQEMQNKLVELLKNNSILAELTDDQIHQLAARAAFISCKSGEVIAEQGTPGSTFYFVLSGQVRAIDISQEPAQLLSYLDSGDFFGERALLLDETRAATVDVVVDSQLAVFDRAAWNWLTTISPGALAGFRRLESLYTEKSRAEFLGRQLDEVVVRKDTRHILAFVATLPSPLILMIFGLAMGIMLYEFEFSGVVIGAVTTLILLLGLIWIFYNYAEWVNDDFIVTSERVIHIERSIFHGETREEAPLTAIQDVSVDIPNFFTRFFGYYNITIQTAGVGNIIFDGLKEGGAIQDAIFYQRAKAMERVRASDTAAIRKSLVNRMRWDVGPVEASTLVATGAAPVKKGLQLPAMVNYFIPRVREQQGNTITWRKHYFILLKLITLPTIAIFVSLYLILAALLGLSPFSNPTPGLVLPLIILWLLIFVWYAYQYDTWTKDIYIVTDTAIIDLKGSPFSLGREERREGPFGNIQNTTYTTASFFTRLLNMGDVVIETAGTADTFTFKQVYDYREVQREVSKRLLAYQEGERKKNRADEERQFTRWLGEYHDLAKATGEVGHQRRQLRP